MVGVQEEAKSPELAEAYVRYREVICRYLLAKTKDPDRAEDLTQEVFLAAVSALKGLEIDERPLLPWFITVARRRYAEDVRRRSTEPTCVSLDEATAVAAPLPEFDADTAFVLIRAIGLLPPSQSRICIMHVLEGKSFAEIQAELGVTESACRMRLARARRTLRATVRV